jgi:hypothetical protein
MRSTSYLVLIALFFLIIACSPKGKEGLISYDPEGSTVTTNKQIDSQHKRTIGVRSEGVWITNEFKTARMNDFYKTEGDTFRVVIEPEIEPETSFENFSIKVEMNSVDKVNMPVKRVTNKGRQAMLSIRLPFFIC